MEYLRVIAAEPHPMGSAAHAHVESYLVDQLQSLGLQTEVQEATSLRQLSEYGQPDIVVGGRVRNVVARVPGTSSTRSILLSGTYDAMPTTSGAADNGAGVATILETVRALRASPPLANDVIILFGDADTNGLIGEAAFAAQHPWAADVGLVVGFGAMGTHGATFPASTSLNSGRVVDAVIATPHPLVYSWAPEVARQTGAGGAALEYIQRGVSTIMLTSVAGWQANHTVIDSVQNIDAGGLQQSGEYALQIVRRFGDTDLADIRAPDQVALTILPDRVVAYPGSWAVPLALAAVIGLASVISLGLRRRQLSPGGLLLSVLVFVGLVVAAVAGTTLMWWAIRAMNTNHAVFMAGTYGIVWYFAGFFALTLALFLTVGTRVARRIREANLAAGVLVSWAALAVPISAGLPSLSAILVWPLIAAVVLLGWTMIRPLPDGSARAIALALAAVPALLLVTPFIYILLPLTDKISAMRGLPLLGVPILLVALVCGILLPQLLFIRPTEQRRVWMLPATCFAGAIILIASGWINSGFSPTQPRPDYLAYALDADTHQAYWVSVPQQLDGWTQQFFPHGAPVESINFTPSPDYFPNRRFAALRTPAPIVEIPPRELSVIDDDLSAVSRVLRLRALSPREANTLELRLQSTTPILQASIDEHPIDVTKALSGSHQTLRLVLEAPHLDGFDIDLVLQGSGGVHGTLTDYSNGLPAQIPVAMRPADTMPAVFDFTDPTIVSRSMAIPPAADTLVSESLP